MIVIYNCYIFIVQTTGKGFVALVLVAEDDLKTTFGSKKVVLRRYDIQHNDIQHNDTQHADTQYTK
jgi:hypothetical protein